MYSVYSNASGKGKEGEDAAEIQNPLQGFQGF